PRGRGGAGRRRAHMVPPRNRPDVDVPRDRRRARSPARPRRRPRQRARRLAGRPARVRGPATLPPPQAGITWDRAGQNFGEPPIEVLRPELGPLTRPRLLLLPVGAHGATQTHRDRLCLTGVSARAGRG